MIYPQMTTSRAYEYDVYEKFRDDLFDIIKNDVKFNIGFGIIFLLFFFKEKDGIGFALKSRGLG